MVSSENRQTFDLHATLLRSLINIRKSSEPRIDPCGSPHSIGIILDSAISMKTINDRSEKKLSISEVDHGLKL